MKSLKIKLYNLFQNDICKLETLSNEHRLLYNFLLEKVLNDSDFKSLNEFYKNYRNERKLTINSKSAQNTCRSLINNVKSFYSLRKKDKTACFPYKFKSYKFFQSFTLDWNNGGGGFKISDSKLTINLLNKSSKSPKLIINLPEVVSENNINETTIRTITFKRDQKNNYFLILVYSEKKKEIVKNDNFLSIDLGISELVTCFSNKVNNFSVKNNKFESLNKQIDKLQSIKDKKQKKSKKYIKINKTFKRKKKKLTNKLKDFQHKVSYNVINICKKNNISKLIVGDIQTKKIIKTENKKIKSTSKNFGLSRFKTFLEYKSKSEGIDFYKVDESYTTQTNCLTGKRDFKEISLKEREVSLTDTVKIDRDLNSAINIYKKTMGICSTHLLENILSNNNYNSLDKMYFDTKNNVLKYEEYL